jgi:hypothetical protein
MENNLVSVDEKTHIVNQFIKNLAYSRYNIALSLMLENSISNPNQNNIQSFTTQLQEIDDKMAALQQELLELEGE